MCFSGLTNESSSCGQLTNQQPVSLPGSGAGPLDLGVLRGHGLGLVVTRLGLLQTPDGLPALVLGQETLSVVAVGIGQVELGLQLKVGSPVPKLTNRSSY